MRKTAKFHEFAKNADAVENCGGAATGDPLLQCGKMKKEAGHRCPASRFL
jgi:hypothetical protein